MRSIFPISNKSGFTLVEMLVIAPVAILIISGFVTLMISMVGDVLVTRDQGNMAYETQDALNRIEQDTRLSTQFLVTTGTMPSPQGSDSNFTGTAAFSSSNSLILGSLTTDKNPADTTRQLIYYANQPNDCGTLQSYNRVFQSKVTYFIKGGSLWRRAVLPDYNTNSTVDDNTVCNAPWQRDTCSPGYTGTRCKTNDSELMKNVDSFSVKYLSDPGSTTDLGSTNALSANAIEVTLTGKQKTAGRDVTSSGTIRATKLNAIDVDLPAPGVPDVTSSVVGTSINFSWDAVPNATSYVISYNVNGGSWVNATTDGRTKTYSVHAGRGDTATIRVAAKNSTDTSASDTASASIPSWTACGLQNGWANYANGYPDANYSITDNDVVYLKGLIRNGTTSVGTVICTLPEGYRPTSRLVFATATAATGIEGVAGRIDVLPNGDVVVDTVNSSWVSLESIRFVASAAPYTWSSLPLSNGWVNYNNGFATMQSTVDTIGRVHTQGLVKSGNYGDWVGIGTLPTSQRPFRNSLMPSYGNNGFSNFMVTNGDPPPITARGINSTGYYSMVSSYYPLPLGSWSNLSLLSGWVPFDNNSYNPAQYTKSSDGVVTLRGLIKNGTAAAGTVLAQLPPGYRPKERLLNTMVGGGQFARIDILANGNIEIRLTNSSFTSLEGISFIAEQ